MGSGLFSPKWWFAGLALAVSVCAPAFGGEDDARPTFEDTIKSQANASDVPPTRNPFEDDFGNDAFSIRQRPDRIPLDNFKIESFVALSDFLKIGYECYGRYVVKRGAEYTSQMAELRKAAEGAVGVLEITNKNKARGRYFMSGALINGGRHFLTAGHFDSDATTTFLVRVNDGRALTAKLAVQRARDKGDWAIFEVTAGSVNGATAKLPSLEVTIAVADNELFILGYPCTKFIHEGRIIAGDKCSFRGRPFPLLAQKTAEVDGNWVLQGLAGATPLPGSSGSPVLNVSTGKIVAIYVAQASDGDDMMREVPGDTTILQVVPTSELRAEFDRLKIPYDASGGRRSRK